MPVASSGASTFAATKPSTGIGSNAMLATSVTNASPANVPGPRFQSRIASAYHASARSAGTLLDSRPDVGNYSGNYQATECNYAASPRYAARTLGSCSSDEASPDRITSPDSIT